MPPNEVQQVYRPYEGSVQPHIAPHTPAPPPPPPPPMTQPIQSDSLGSYTSDQPVPVVRVLSIRGVEYAMMTIALWFTAAGLAWVLLNLINGSSGFDFLVVPLSVLITSVPFFAFFFLRLKRAELANPALRMEPSKRRMSQITQILAFLALIINISIFVYGVLQMISGQEGYSAGKSVLNLLVVIVIAGGILAYYWFDEHRTQGK